MTNRISCSLALALALGSTGCRYRPARFADHPAVVKVGDDLPIPVPDRNDFDELLHVSDVYLRRPLFDALSPAEPPEAADVNAFDEVPVSSWYAPPRQLSEILADHDAPLGGPPVAPLVLLDDAPTLGSSSGGLTVVDARGARYELEHDDARRPELRTGAAAVGSRALRGLGIRTPDVWIVELAPGDIELSRPSGAPEPLAEDARARARAREKRLVAFFDGGPKLPPNQGRHRVSATRWAAGIDVGITPDFGSRGDDANDLIAHNDRRTLRALSLFGSFLAFDGFGVRRTRDVYVGEPGKGHLVHYVVGLDRSLGAGSVVDPLPPYRPLSGRRGESTWQNLVLLGFAPAPRPKATQRRYLSLGTIGPLANPLGMDTALPYGPFVRLSRADGYWAAKRIAGLLSPASTLEAIVDAGQFGDRAARDELLLLLRLRARQIVGHWFHQVTPIEVLTTEDTRLVLRDEAIFGGYAPAEEIVYELAYLDGEGRALAPPWTLQAQSHTLVLDVPKTIVDPKRSAVLHIRASRRGHPAPAFCDVHLAFYVGGVRAYAVTHLPR